MAVKKSIKSRNESAVVSDYFDMLKRNLNRATTSLVYLPYEKY